MKFPDKNQRTDCNSARDKYFACLDDNNLWLSGYRPTDDQIPAIDPLHPEIQPHTRQNNHLYVCAHLQKMFESSCLKSWVWHFNMTRTRNLQKDYQIAKMAQQEKDRAIDSKQFWQKVQK